MGCRVLRLGSAGGDFDRVEQAESEFADASSALTDDTPLSDASELFNSAAVALEMAWLRLFADAGCLADEQQQQAEASVRAYTTALQQELTTAGYYTGAIDGIYGLGRRWASVTGRSSDRPGGREPAGRARAAGHRHRRHGHC